MFDVPAAYVYFIELTEYEVSFAIKKPFARSEETVKANSSSSARHIIETKYGKENITIYYVHKVPKSKK
jgi:hypothetical protein